jgi:Ca2+-binding EF-hand superfamily protein
MRTNPILTLTAATALLFGTAVAAAQTTDPDHDAHHPEQAQEAPAAQPQQPGAASQGTPGMMGMNPQMMQMMQRMMRMQQDSDQAGMGMTGPGMTGMMGRGMMRHGGMHAGMARMAFILLDTDGDGALSLEEVQAVTERIFNAIDADDDGRVTLEEIQAFHRGTGPAARQTQMRQDMPMHQGMQMPEGTPMDPASQAYMDAMQTMMEGMADMEMTGDAAIDFALMMIPHHQSAIDMAETLLEHSDDPELTELANAIIAEQQREIEFLENWLRQEGQRQ